MTDVNPTTPTELTSSQLEEKINAMTGGNQTEVQPPIEAQTGNEVTTPVAAVQPGQVETVQTPQPSSDAGNTPPAQVETKPVSAFDELAQKKGIKTPEDLAVMYKNLEKFATKKAQEASQKEVPQPQPYQQPAPAQPVQEQPYDPNAAFVEALSKNPIATIAKLVDYVSEQKMAPVRSLEKDAALNKELIRLSTSPETRNTFNIPEVHDEIAKIIEANPKYADNLSENLETLHDIALGRLARKGFSVAGTQTNQGLEPVIPVEGRTKPGLPQTIDRKKATAAELEAYINSITQQQ